MAKGAFGETITQATGVVVRTTKSPWTALAGVALSLSVAVGEAWVSSRHADATDTKAVASESAVVKGVEDNAKSLAAALTAVADLQKQHAALGRDFRRSVIALQSVVKEHDKKLLSLVVHVEVEDRIRRERGARPNRNTYYAAPPVQSAAAKLEAPVLTQRKVPAPLDALRKNAQSRRVKRVWSK